jgi:hypothetical protein
MPTMTQDAAKNEMQRRITAFLPLVYDDIVSIQSNKRVRARGGIPAKNAPNYSKKSQKYEAVPKLHFLEQ